MHSTSISSRLDRLFLAVADHAAEPCRLLVRVVWGWLFFQTGLGKLGNLAGTTEFFASLGLPMPGVNALFVGALEMLGGLLLMAGLWSRKAAFLLVGNMLVAYLTAHRDAFASLAEFADADPCAFLVASLVVLAFGPGRWSVDGLRSRNAASAPSAVAGSPAG